MTRPLDGVFETPELFDFYYTVRQLEARNGDKPRVGLSAAKRQDYVRFGEDPFFAYPAQTIAAARRKGDAFEILQQFLGLLGPQGAMPLSLTEEAYRNLRENDDALARFMDLFNNRFVQLFFRAWANSRPVVHRDRPEDDRFETYVGSHIGLGSTALRQLDSLPDLVKLGFAGLMSAKVKSAARLRGLLAGVFGMRAEIEEFVGMQLVFDPDQRTRIGAGFCGLGKDALLGAGVYSVQDKIRIRLYAATLAQYREFLPSGRQARQLSDLVFFYLGAEIAWDVELALPVGEVRPTRLDGGAQLGWTSWMAPNWTVEKGSYRTDSRFDLAGRFGRN